MQARSCQRNTDWAKTISAPDRFYCDAWLQACKPKVKESTYVKYSIAIERHIKPKLGGCFPLGLNTGIVDDFTRESLFEDELAPKRFTIFL